MASIFDQLVKYLTNFDLVKHVQAALDDLDAAHDAGKVFASESVGALSRAMRAGAAGLLPWVVRPRLSGRLATALVTGGGRPPRDDTPRHRDRRNAPLHLRPPGGRGAGPSTVGPAGRARGRWRRPRRVAGRGLDRRSCPSPAFGTRCTNRCQTDN